MANSGARFQRSAVPVTIQNGGSVSDQRSGLSLIDSVVVAVELFGVVVLHPVCDLEEEVDQPRGGLVGEVERGR